MRRAEHGAATVLVLACVGVVLLLGAALAVTGLMVVAQRTAQTAADLAALAAASSPEGCAAADALARGNGTQLLSCRLEGREAFVEVLAPGPRWLGQDHDLTARARAGP